MTLKSLIKNNKAVTIGGLLLFGNFIVKPVYHSFALVSVGAGGLYTKAWPNAILHNWYVSVPVLLAGASFVAKKTYNKNQSTKRFGADMARYNYKDITPALASGLIAEKKLTAGLYDEQQKIIRISGDITPDYRVSKEPFSGLTANEITARNSYQAKQVEAGIKLIETHYEELSVFNKIAAHKQNETEYAQAIAADAAKKNEIVSDIKSKTSGPNYYVSFVAKKAAEAMDNVRSETQNAERKKGEEKDVLTKFGLCTADITDTQQKLKKYLEQHVKETNPALYKTFFENHEEILTPVAENKKVKEIFEKDFKEIRQEASDNIKRIIKGIPDKSTQQQQTTGQTTPPVPPTTAPPPPAPEPQQQVQTQPEKPVEQQQTEKTVRSELLMSEFTDNILGSLDWLPDNITAVSGSTATPATSAANPTGNKPATPLTP